MDWKSVVSKVAPVLGTALGGPFGGMATKFLTGKLLGEEMSGKAAENALQEFVQGANPEQMVRLKELDNDFELEMERLGVKREELATEDRASARTMGVQTTLLPQMVISAIFVTAFTIILYTVFTNTIQMNEVQKNVTMYLLGILSAGMVQIMNFWFGSSSGSKEKTAKFEGQRNG